MLNLTGHSGQVTALAFSPDGRWLATTGWDGSCRLWDRRDYQQRRCLRTPYEQAMTVAFSSDSENLAIGFGNRRFASDPWDFGKVAWTATTPLPGDDADYLSARDTWRAAGDHATWVHAALIHPRRCELAVYGGLTEIQVWNPESRQIVRSHSLGAEFFAIDLTYSPDGATLAATALGDDTGTIFLWDERRHDPVRWLVKRDTGHSIAYSPDGTNLYVGFQSGRLIWWNMVSPRPPTMAQVADSCLVDMAFAPDGRSLLLACEDGQIRLWDVASRQARATYDWEIGTITAVAFAPDGLTAAAAGDSVIQVWDVDG